MKPRTYAYIGGGLLAASILAVASWGPLSDAAPSTTPVFAVDASWPNPLPAPVGTDGVAHAWVQGEVAASCIDKYDNVYTFNRGWEVGVTVNGVLQGNQGGGYQWERRHRRRGDPVSPSRRIRFRRQCGSRVG